MAYYVRRSDAKPTGLLFWQIDPGTGENGVSSVPSPWNSFARATAWVNQHLLNQRLYAIYVRKGKLMVPIYPKEAR